MVKKVRVRVHYLLHFLGSKQEEEEYDDAVYLSRAIIAGRAWYLLTTYRHF